MPQSFSSWHPAEHNQVAFPKHVEKMTESQRLAPASITINEPLFISSVVGNPYQDIVAVLHDGIKMELKQAYEVFHRMKRDNFLVDRGHIVNFYKWWEGFEKALQDCFTIEEQVLCAQIENYKQMPARLGASQRQQDKMKIVKASVEIGHWAPRFEKQSTPEAVRELISLMDCYSATLLAYFKKKENVIPSCLREVQQQCPNILEQIERKTLRKVRTINGRIFLVLYTKQMDQKDLEAYKKKYFSFGDRRFYASATREYSHQRVQLLSKDPLNP